MLVTIAVTRHDNPDAADSFEAWAERAEPFWATAEGHGTTPEDAASKALAALPPVVAEKIDYTEIT